MGVQRSHQHRAGRLNCKFPSAWLLSVFLPSPSYFWTTALPSPPPPAGWHEVARRGAEVVRYIQGRLARLGLPPVIVLVSLWIFSLFFLVRVSVAAERPKAHPPSPPPPRPAPPLAPLLLILHLLFSGSFPVTHTALLQGRLLVLRSCYTDRFDLVLFAVVFPAAGAAEATRCSGFLSGAVIALAPVKFMTPAERPCAGTR